MKILNNIELMDLAVYAHNTLIFADFHIGYEESLNKRGLMLPRFQFDDVMKRIEAIFLRLKNHKLDTIVINGDLKHEFGNISGQEWRNTLKLLDYLGRHCNEIVLVKGNHDKILGPIAGKRNIKIVEHYLIGPMVSTIEQIPINNKIQLKIDSQKQQPKTNGAKLINDKKYGIENKNPFKKISINNKIQLKINNKRLINGQNSIGNKNKILVMHGDKIPDKNLLKDVSTIIIGHEHPAVSVSEGQRTELFKAYLIGKWKNKSLIVQPSFNLVTEGNDVLRNCYAISGTPKILKEFFSVTKEEVLSPFLKQDLGKFDVIVVADKLYNFGLVKNIQR